jgi:hypothetical protein
MAQRFGWAGVFGFVLAGLLGVLGQGPLSGKSVAAQNGSVRVEYNRFVRRQAPEDLRIHIRPGPDGAARVWMGPEYLRRLRIERVTPQPVSVESASGRLTYVFRATGDAPLEVAVVYEFVEFGPVAGELGIPGGASLQFNQFVYP